MSEPFQSTTQQFLDIYDITNNFVIMKDGTVSVILTVDAMNFGLLAEEEQDAIMYAYAGLLNSLNYPIQIIVQSRTKDVTAYLKLLQEQESVTENETMRRRIGMYREFVGNLIHERNVLDKKFYVVIPASSLELGFMTASSVLPGSASFDIKTVERSVILEKAQNLLDPKRDHLIAQFARIGLYSRQLNTQEIIQLFYVRYNPEAAEGQQIGESNMYTTPLVRASVQESAMINAAQAQQGTPASTTDTAQPQKQPVTPQAEQPAPTGIGTPPQTPPQTVADQTVPSTTAAPQQPSTAMGAAAVTPAAAPVPPANQTGPAQPVLPPAPELPEDAPIAPQPETKTNMKPSPTAGTTPEDAINTAATGGTQTSPSTPAAATQTTIPNQAQTNPEPRPNDALSAAPEASSEVSTADVSGIPQPVASQASTTPPAATVTTPASAPAPAQTAGVSSESPDEQATQHDLDAAIQQIGGTQPDTGTTAAKPAAPDGDLPALPEI